MVLFHLAYAGGEPEDRTPTSVFLGGQVTVLSECEKHAQPRRPRVPGGSGGRGGGGALCGVLESYAFPGCLVKSEGAGTISLSNSFSQESRHSNEKLTNTHAQPWHDERGVPNDSTDICLQGSAVTTKNANLFQAQGIVGSLGMGTGNQGYPSLSGYGFRR